MEHVRNHRLAFDEASHTYTLDGTRQLTSVTTVIESFFPSFDPDAAIEKLKRRGTHPLAKHEPAEIKAIWEARAAESRQAGTLLHEAIEKHLLGESVTGYVAEIDYVNGLRERVLGKFVATEWAIFDEQWGIAGTLDALFEDHGRYRLADWKRSVIKTSNRWERAEAPIAHLQACNFEKYSLQMTLYALILERQYGMAPAALPSLMVQLHPDKPFQAIGIANRRREVLAMMDIWCQRQTAQNRPS